MEGEFYRQKGFHRIWKVVNSMVNGLAVSIVLEDQNGERLSVRYTTLMTQYERVNEDGSAILPLGTNE